MGAFTSYLLAAMMAWVPPRPSDVPRYHTIAEDAVAVAFDENEQPAFEGAYSREKTALLLLSIASLESNFRADVDRGDVRGDHGRSWGLFQINIGTGRTVEGWSGAELVNDRRKGFRVALRLVRYSLNWCRHLPEPDRLSGYTRGKCARDVWSRARMGRADRWWKAHPFGDT
jgi:hypothetical protein